MAKPDTERSSLLPPISRPRSITRRLDNKRLSPGHFILQICMCTITFRLEEGGREGFFDKMKFKVVSFRISVRIFEITY